MPLTQAAQKLCLDWILNGASPTRPPGCWVSLGTATPTSQSAFDGMFTPRMTASFAPANSPAGSASLAAAMSCTVSGAASLTANGLNIYDSSAGGTRLWYGGIPAIGCKSGDNAAFTAGALTLVIN